MQPSSPDAHTSIPSTFFKYLHTLIQNRPCKCLHYITWYVDLKYCPWYLLIVLVPRPDLALRHLQWVDPYPLNLFYSDLITPTRIASSLSPEDPEIAFNHAAVLEASQFSFFSAPVLKTAIVLCLTLAHPHFHRLWAFFFHSSRSTRGGTRKVQD